MFHKLLPRTYELCDLSAATSHSDTYFKNFDEILQKYDVALDSWKLWEKEFQGLDADAWKFLKEETRPRLIQKDPLRGWSSLFTILNQARAYNYLASIKFKSIRFIPRSKSRTPDLQAIHGSKPLLCEVKTMNVSAEELKARRSHEARDIYIRLGDGFFKKLMCDITEAKEQLDTFDPNRTAENYIYLNVCFDEWVGDCHELYFKQIDQYLSENPVDDVKLVFQPDTNYFKRKYSMNSATVIS